MSTTRDIEAIIASPPERDELVVQLFRRDHEQWGEIYRDSNEYWIDLYYLQHEGPVRFKVAEMIDALATALNALRERLEST